MIDFGMVGEIRGPGGHRAHEGARKSHGNSSNKELQDRKSLA